MKMNRCAGRMCLYVCGIVAFVAFLQVQAKPVDKTVLIEGIPHLRQKPDFCGEACIAMYLKKLGYKVTQDDVFNLSGVEPALARGCVTKDMERVLKSVGFKPGIVRYKIDPRKIQRSIGGSVEYFACQFARWYPIDSMYALRRSSQIPRALSFGSWI